jgi:hypothetical protein
MKFPSRDCFLTWCLLSARLWIPYSPVSSDTKDLKQGKWASSVAILECPKGSLSRLRALGL